jgi:hypothetical protein
MTAITKEHTIRATEDLIILIDEKIQDELYEKLTSGMVDRERFEELTEKFRTWQRLCRELISAIV